MLCHITNQTGKDFPCGKPHPTDPVVPCCVKGDICLTNGICSYQKSSIGGSGYYVAGCTASSGLCPGFPTRCTSHFLPDVTWNSTSGLQPMLWRRTRTTPTQPATILRNEQFVATGPQRSCKQSSRSRGIGRTATSTALHCQRAHFCLPPASSTTPRVRYGLQRGRGRFKKPTSPPSIAPSGLLQRDESRRWHSERPLALLSVLGLVACLIVRKRRRRLCSEQDTKLPVNSDSSAALHELQDPESSVRRTSKQRQAGGQDERSSKPRARTRGSTLRICGRDR